MRAFRYIVALLVVTGACGNPADRHVDPDPYDDQPTDEPTSATPKIQPKVLSANGETLHIYTYHEVARQLRMPVGFATLAGLGCSRQSRCIPDFPAVQLWDCKVELAQLWCPPNTCDDGGLSDSSDEWEECYEATYTRSCDNLNPPIDCPLLRKLGMTELSPMDWKLP